MGEKVPKSVHIRLELEDKLAKEFLGLKDYYGFPKNTDLVRFLFHKEYLRIFSPNNTPMEEVAIEIE